MAMGIDRQWYAACLVANEDGSESIEPGIWVAVIVPDAVVIDGELAPKEYKACAGQSEIEGMTDAEVKVLLEERITETQAGTRRPPQVQPGPSADLGVGDLTG